ncbi:MAG TPA: tetratricopeptide repeat protein [Pseudomonadota bacterium]|nr:tetratricopeptide repeat protein [Pseudomonadota bacterium]
MPNLGNKEKYIAQAQKLVEKGQFDKAIREYLKAVAEDDSDIRIWIRIGDLYVKQGQKAEATENYKKVAGLYRKAGDADKAAAVYRQIQAISPQNPDAFVALAELLREGGRTAQAIQQYEQGADLLMRAGRPREALLAEQAVVDLSPESISRRIRLAELYSRQNMYTDAAREFSAAAMQLRRAGRLDEFVKVAERLLFVAPDNTEIIKELSRCHIEQGDAQRALTRLQAGFNLNGKDAEILDLLSQAFVLLGKPDKAVAVLKELAHIYTQRGASTFAVYQRILQLAPDDAEARNGLTQAAGLKHTESMTGSLRAMILSSPAISGGASPSGGTPLTASMMSSRLVTPASGTAISTQFTPAAGTAMALVGQGADQVEDEAANIIAETESFLRFGLTKRALDHLQGALNQNAELKPVRERLIKLYESVREYKSAIAELRVLLGQCSDVQEEVRYLREILRLDDRDQSAQRRLKVITGTHRIDLASFDEPDEPEISLTDGDEDAARRGFTAADRDTSEVPIADYREIVESQRSKPGADDGWAANDAASTSEVPVADFKQYVDKSKPDAQVDPSRSGENRKVSARVKNEPSLPDSAVPIEMGAQPTRPNPLAIGAVAEQVALTSGTLKDELAEVDFLLQQRSLEECRKRLDKLLARHPHSKSVQARQLRLQELEAQVSASDEVVIDVDMDDVREEVILPAPSQASMPIDLASQLSPPSSQISTPISKPVVELRRTIPPPISSPAVSGQSVGGLRRTIPPPISTPGSSGPPTGELRRTIPPPVSSAASGPPGADVRRTLPPEFATGSTPSAGSMRASQRSLPPPPPRPSRIMKAISLTPPPEYAGASDGVPKDVITNESSGAFRSGVALRNRGQYEQAITEFEKCLGDERRAARATLMIGLCHRDQNRVRDAVEAFKLGIHMPGVGEGDLAELNYQLGRSYELLSDAREAIHFYSAAIRRDGRFRDATDRIAALQKSLPPR